MKNLLRRIGFSTGVLLLLALLAPLSVIASDGQQTGCPSTVSPAATTCPPTTVTPAATPAATTCPATPASTTCPVTPAATPASTSCPTTAAPSAYSATTLVGGRTTVEVFCDDFTDAGGTVNRSVLLRPGQFFDVVLCSNPSTGFQWSEIAMVSDTSVVLQGGHSFLPPPGSMVGAAGKEVWTLSVLKEGQTTISFEYSQPWQDGEKARWVFNLILVVSAATPAATPVATPAATTCPVTPAATPATTTCPATPAATPASTACPATPAATPAATTCPAVTTCPTPAVTPAATACPASTSCP